MAPNAFRKKYRKSLLYRLGLKTPQIALKKRGDYRVWIHAVSLGETKAISPLLAEIKDAEIYISTTTQTGQNEAKKLTSNALYLPIDFSWIMKKLVKKIDPDLFILVETDFWYNLLQQLKINETKIALVNGKLSTKSYHRFKYFNKFALALFSKIDLFCLQSDLDKERFLNLGISAEKLTVTGNLKFDAKTAPSNRVDLNFPADKKLVTIALTHDNEEELILNELEKLEGYTFLLAPRHPERFQKINLLLRRMQIPCRSITEKTIPTERVILIDQMGVMEDCYEKSVAVIMGGSFIPYIGGHNIYEAARYGIPVFFGPYTHKQTSLIAALKKHNIGNQISINNLRKTLQEALQPAAAVQLPNLLKTEVEGSTERTMKLIKHYLVKKKTKCYTSCK